MEEERTLRCKNMGLSRTSEQFVRLQRKVEIYISFSRYFNI